MAGRLQGKIARLVESRGYGFIRAEGKEYFFHHTGLENTGMKQLAVGDDVSFEVDEGNPKGPRAESITLLRDPNGVRL